MPFSIGAHPAFALPKPFEEYALEFEYPETLTSFELENDLLSDKATTIKMVDNQIPFRLFIIRKRRFDF